MARITTTHRITGRHGELVSVNELNEFLAGLPGDARISIVETSTGNQLDPGEWSLTASELPKAVLLKPQAAKRGEFPGVPGGIHAGTPGNQVEQRRDLKEGDQVFGGFTVSG